MNYQPRSTNPYIMEKKLNECVGGGGLDPSVLEEIKGSLNSINDKLNNIGDTSFYSGTVSGSSTNTWLDLVIATNLQPGTYVVTANVICSANISNTIGTFALYKNDIIKGRVRMSLELGGGGFLSWVYTIETTSDKIRLMMYDNIPSTISCTGDMEICRIK